MTLKKLTKKNRETEMCKKTLQNLSITERNSIKCLCTSSNLIVWLSRDTLVVAVARRRDGLLTEFLR